MMVLAGRHIPVNLLCPICVSDYESVLHTLVLCPVACGVWSKAGFNFNSAPVSSFGEWWQAVCKGCSVEDRNSVAVILWSLWNNRNNKVWNGKCDLAAGIIHKALSALFLWRAAQEAEVLMHHNVEVEVGFKWLKPTCGSLKCNVDAAVFASEKKIGFGCIIRDENGSLVRAINGGMFAPADPLLVEALGVR
ncbi:hypothetical protein LguiB_007133 [Lonicera macranthoides]